MRIHLLVAITLLVTAAVSAGGGGDDTTTASSPGWFTRQRCALANQVARVSRRILLLLRCEHIIPGGVKPAGVSAKGEGVVKAGPAVSLLDLARGLPAVTGTFTEFLYKNLVVDNRDSVNMAVSPLSVEVVLGAVALGAKSYTQQEIFRVLQVDQDTITIKYHSKISDLDLKTITSVKMATRVYLEKTFFPVKEDFKKALSEVFATEIEQADFIKGSAAEITKINRFVEQMTEKNIKDAVTKDDVNQAVPVLLLNILYFKGEWEVPFKRSLGFNGDFHLPGGRSCKATFMSRNEEYSYYKEVKEGHFRMLELPYLYTETTGQFSMILILPDEVDGLADVERYITADDKWLKDFDLKSTSQTARVQPTVPRFTIDIRIDLKQTLSKMGVTTLFEDSADLSGITTTKELKVANLQQRIFIDVDEKGTKAAAATSAATADIKAIDTKPIVKFNVDHPFAFAIIQRTTKTVLFMGHVVTPNYDELFAAKEEGSSTNSPRLPKEKEYENWLSGKGPKPEGM